MTVNPILTLAPAAESLPLPTTQDKWLLLTGMASFALQQTLPTLGAALYALPAAAHAAAYLTANVARQVFIAKTPVAQHTPLLKRLLSPWTLLAAYACRGWSGWDLPEKIVTGASALTLLHHAGQSMKNSLPIATKGHPMAIAACVTHLANALLGIAAAAASWNAHSFLNFWPKTFPNYIQEGTAQTLVSLDRETKKFFTDSTNCQDFIHNVYYLNGAWIVGGRDVTVSAMPVAEPYDLAGTITTLTDAGTGYRQLHFDDRMYQSLQEVCKEKSQKLHDWLRSPEFYFRHNTAVIWKEVANRIYQKNLPGTEASEVWRHMFGELQPRLQDFFSHKELEYLEEIKIEEVIVGANFYPEWIEKHGFEKYVNKMVQWWEKEWYPAWSGMETRWQNADLPRKDEFDVWIHSVIKDESLIYQPKERFLSKGLSEEAFARKENIRLENPSEKRSAYKKYIEEHGAITANALYQTKEKNYHQWMAFRNLLEKDFPLHKIREFEGKAKSRTHLSNCSTKICSLIDFTFNRGWHYKDHSKEIDHASFNSLSDVVYVQDLYGKWKKAYEVWLKKDTFLSRTPEEIAQEEAKQAKIDEAKQKYREERKKAREKYIADQLHRWLTTPFQKIIEGLSPLKIDEMWGKVNIKNAKIIWKKLSEEEREILREAGRIALSVARKAEQLKRKH